MIRLVGEGKKVEDRKWWENEKVEKQKRFEFSFFLFSWEWKNEMMKKMRLYKFMHIPLLKNNAQFKPKGINNKKNINHLNLLKNKSHV